MLHFTQHVSKFGRILVLVKYQTNELTFAGFITFSPAWDMFSMDFCCVSCSVLCSRDPAAILTNWNGSRESPHHSFQTIVSFGWEPTSSFAAVSRWRGEMSSMASAQPGSTQSCCRSPTCASVTLFSGSSCTSRMF